MVSTELYVAGLKRKEMVEITHGSSVEGSRGTRYRLYGTYTDPETKKIHKANSFVSKDKYDEITAKMTAGMPVADMTIEKVEVFAEESPVDAEPSDLGGPSEPDDAGVPADVGGDEPVPMGDEPSDIQEFEAETNVGTTIDDIVMDEYLDEGEALEDAEEYARKARQALTDESPRQEIVEEVEVTPVEIEEPRRPEPGTWAGVALDMAMMSNDDDNFDWNAWKDEMKEGRGAESYESYRKRAEMTLREWGESEIDEEKHDFTQNPNESFREWLDEEVRAHGDISFREWADEEEGEETKAAETVTKSAETDQDMETIDTQVAVALGIPPEIWRDTSRDKQDAYIASMMLDVMDIRDLAKDGEFELIMAMANDQKEDVTSGDLSLIECNVCGITASQLLGDLGGVCDITDPNGGANPNWVRGVSCPFEKYYSLTRAVYDEVEDELRDSRTVVQIYNPRPAMAMVAESVSKRASRYSRVGRTFNGRGYRKYRSESLMDITKDTSLGDFTSKELTESSAIQGDFDHASLNFSGRQNIQARAESQSFRAYDDAISDRQRYKIQELGGKVDSSMNRSEASDYIKELQGRESGTWKSAETLQANSWDNLYVVAENQMGGWEACDVTDGVLQTYANQADADREAQMTIDDLNSMGGDYGPNSWAGKRLSDVEVADNVEFIRYPNGLEAPYDEVHQGRSMNDPVTQLKATRGIDTFTEPFEETRGLSHWLGALGIAGAAILTYFFIPKGD